MATPKKRTIPGPVGSLPLVMPSDDDPNSGERQANILAAIKQTESEVKKSRINGLEFLSNAWTSLMNYVGLQRFTLKSLSGTHELSCIRCCIGSVNSGEFPQKVPYLLVYVKSCRTSLSDVSVVLMDPTGEIQGTVHRRAYDSVGADFAIGCCLMLVNVPLFSPSGRAYYLTISTENIVKCIPTTSPVLEDDGNLIDFNATLGRYKVSDVTKTTAPTIVTKTTAPTIVTKTTAPTIVTKTTAPTSVTKTTAPTSVTKTPVVANKQPAQHPVAVSKPQAPVSVNKAFIQPQPQAAPAPAPRPTVVNQAPPPIVEKSTFAVVTKTPAQAPAVDVNKPQALPDAGFGDVDEFDALFDGIDACFDV